jgi:hypothetical protein
MFWVVAEKVTAPEAVSVVNAPVDADDAPTVVPSIAPPLMSTKSNIWMTFVPSTYKCALRPFGTVMPVPPEVLTVMLCEPVVLFWTMYCFWMVGTTSSRVAVKLTADVTFKTSARAAWCTSK